MIKNKDMKKLITLFIFSALFALSYGQDGTTVKVSASTGGGVSQIDSTVTITDLAEDTSPEKALTLDGTTMKYSNYVDIDTVTFDTINAGTIRVNDVLHQFCYFGDSSISFSYTTAWQHLTNATNDMYIDLELDGFSVSNDTFTVENTADYDLTAKHALDGDNGETISIRFLNVTTGAGIPVAGAKTARGANNFLSIATMGYATFTANDKYVLQIKGDANGTSVIKNGIIKIYYVHE